MTTILLALASLGAPHHAAPLPPIKALATWEKCSSVSGCRWFPLKHAHRRPMGHWHSCSVSPAETVCRTFPLFRVQRPRIAPKPTPRAIATPVASASAAKGTTVQYITTGYAPPAACGASGLTANRIMPYYGVAAAAATIPFGTRGYVPEYGPFVVEDRGGAIGPGRLDLYFPTCAQAMQWGVRSVAVTFYP